MPQIALAARIVREDDHFESHGTARGRGRQKHLRLAVTEPAAGDHDLGADADLFRVDAGDQLRPSLLRGIRPDAHRARLEAVGEDERMALGAGRSRQRGSTRTRDKARKRVGFLGVMMELQVKK